MAWLLLLRNARQHPVSKSVPVAPSAGQPPVSEDYFPSP